MKKKLIFIISAILIFIIIIINNLYNKDIVLDRFKDTTLNKNIILSFDKEYINLQLDNNEIQVTPITQDLIKDYEYSMNKIENYLLVGITNKKTVKYSSLSSLYIYDYVVNPVTKIWCTDDELENDILFRGYNTINNTITVEIDSYKLNINYDETIEKKLVEFITKMEKKNLEIKLEVGNNIAYCVKDYDNDGKKELITKSIVTMGHCPLVDIYYSVYEFNNNGIQKIKSCFHSQNSSFEKYFNNFN